MILSTNALPHVCSPYVTTFFLQWASICLYIMLPPRNLSLNYPIDNEQVLISHVLNDWCTILYCFSSPDVCTANQIMTSDWLKGVVMATPESKSTTPVKGSSSGCSKVARRRVSFVRYVGDKKHYIIPPIYIASIPFYTSSFLHKRFF